MSAILGALAPIFLLIALGHWMKRSQFLPDAFWPSADKITYYVTFPALIASNLVEAPLASMDLGGMAFALVAAKLTVTLLVLLGRHLLGVDGPAFSSVMQGSVRFNTYVGLGVVAAVWGGDGIALFSVAIAVIIPLVNLISVATIVHYAGKTPMSLRGMLLPLAQNPLILGCVVGALLNLAAPFLPVWLPRGLKVLGAAALPMGLLSVGAGLSLAALRGAGRPIFASAAMKLVLLPVIAGGAAMLLGVSGPALGLCIMFAGLPCATASYVLARQMGGDVPLMASIITAQHLAAAATLPILLYIAGRLA